MSNSKEEIRVVHGRIFKVPNIYEPSTHPLVEGSYIVQIYGHADPTNNDFWLKHAVKNQLENGEMVDLIVFRSRNRKIEVKPLNGDYYSLMKAIDVCRARNIRPEELMEDRPCLLTYKRINVEAYARAGELLIPLSIAIDEKRLLENATKEKKHGT